MSTRYVLLAVVALATAGAACQPPAQQAGPLSEEDVAAIRTSTDEYVRATLAGDAAAFVALYSEHAAILPPNAPALDGRAAIQAWVEGDTEAVINQFTLTPVQIEGRGDLAFVRGTYSMEWTPEGALEPIQDSGKYVEILQKQADGSWLIAVDTWNSDLPLPEEGSGT